MTSCTSISDRRGCSVGSDSLDIAVRIANEHDGSLRIQSLKHQIAVIEEVWRDGDEICGETIATLGMPSGAACFDRFQILTMSVYETKVSIMDELRMPVSLNDPGLRYRFETIYCHYPDGIQ